MTIVTLGFRRQDERELPVAEAIETTRIDSVAGRTGDPTAFVTRRPCLAPLHNLRCGADRRRPDADAGRSVAGAPWGALAG
jgi:hypothetical protein